MTSFHGNGTGIGLSRRPTGSARYHIYTDRVGGHDAQQAKTILQIGEA